MNRRFISFLISAILLMASFSCAPAPVVVVVATSTAAAAPTPTATALPAEIPVSTLQEVLANTGHVMKPADVPVPAEFLVYDVRSAAKKRAPYGDSYDINRLERPFLQDMKYVPEIDIVSFEAGEDADWYYVSIHVSGNNPNKKLGIDYGVELDLDADGFGDILIWATPPFGTEWDTQGVKVYRDTDHDTAGVSSARSDAGFSGNGFDSLIFDGASGQGEDPDLAWVRMQEGTEATMQFAFKKALSGPTFLVGVMADGGLRDVSKLDYNDRFKVSEAGSPIRGYTNYPLKMLFAVDNTCWQAYGMKNPTTVAKVCPPAVTETITTKLPAVRDNAPPAPATSSQATVTSYP